jgi:hypothetical protein
MYRRYEYRFDQIFDLDEDVFKYRTEVIPWYYINKFNMLEYWISKPIHHFNNVIEGVTIDCLSPIDNELLFRWEPIPTPDEPASVNFSPIGTYYLSYDTNIHSTLFKQEQLKGSEGVILEISITDQKRIMRDHYIGFGRRKNFNL